MTARDRIVGAARRYAGLREFNASPLWRRVPIGRMGRTPIALVYGNCQAPAVRKILLTHPGAARDFHFLRIPAVHEFNARDLRLLQKLLPRVDVLITQDVKADFQGMELGTEQLVERLGPDAKVIRYPNAFFEGVFPFHVYVKHEGNPVATPAPITDYHDTRILYAASHGWDASATNAWLNELQLDPQWIRDNAEASLRELARREADMPVQLTQLIRPKITDSFHTINHPINELVVEVVRQVLEQLGYADADRVLSSHQTDLEHVNAPREPQILRALGTEPSPSEPTHWRTPAGEFSMDQIVDAHLALFAADPALLASGLVKHKERLEVLHA